MENNKIEYMEKFEIAFRLLLKTLIISPSHMGFRMFVLGKNQEILRKNPNLLEELIEELKAWFEIEEEFYDKNYSIKKIEKVKHYFKEIAINLDELKNGVRFYF